MIRPDYCRVMARYNAWQNWQLHQALVDPRLALPDAGQEPLRRDRGAFWGSILGTLSHLLWGDLMWMARFDGGAPPSESMAASAGMFTGVGDWAAARQGTDKRISRWAGVVTQSDLDADLSWYSGVLKADVRRPLGLCAVHFFNHQTHHRGQVHTMLTQAGVTAPVSDLFLMPEQGEWLS